MLKTTKTTKIYILCPANAETGGPEALYTLGYELRKLGFDSYMSVSYTHLTLPTTSRV